jgi:D-alanyl-D-alanine carboxypeptidase/D-alanyl-D-alanine-endopeptidase (penicillin-binding protein 4)
MLKRIGREVTGEPGSWASGASVVRMTIAERLGPDDAAATQVSDGSGLSRDNKVSPATLTRWLDMMQRSGPTADDFVASLATTDRGNLKKRFDEHRLQNDLAAKSGSIDGVRCLSGYLTDPATDRRVAFSIMVNDLKAGEAPLAALNFHEEVVKAIDRWMTAQRPAARVDVGG